MAALSAAMVAAAGALAVGAPTRAPLAGTDGAIRAAAATSAVVDRRTGCVKPAILANPPRLAPPRFPLVDLNKPNPICRLAQRRTIDVPLGSGAGDGTFDPRPRCGNYDPGRRCFPSAFRHGNARVRRTRFAPPLRPADPLIPLHDSFGAIGDSPRSAQPFAYIEPGPFAGCFNIYDKRRRLRGSTDPRFPEGRCDATTRGRSLVTIEFQGRGCMVTRNVERRFVIAGLLQTPGKEAALNTGLRGFIPLTAVPVAPGVDRRRSLIPDGTRSVPGGLKGAEFRYLQDAYPGCGRKAGAGMTALPAGQTAPADTELHVADNMALSATGAADGSRAWPNPAFPFPDQYLNATTVRKGCKTQSAAMAVAGCSGFYGNYQGPCYAPEIAGVALSTTYVSGTGTTRADNPGDVRAGGVVRALVRRDDGPGTFAPVDRMLFADNNVPDAQGAVVTWVFGNFNPMAALASRISGAVGGDMEQNIWGWTAIRQPRVAPGHFTC